MYYSDYLITYYIVMFIVSIVGGCIFGAITKAINESKGYYGGFAWGFWLGWIGIIVVACKPSNRYTPTQSIIKPANNTNAPTVPQHIANARPSNNSWQCSCGRYNAQYVSSCTCGLSKRQTTAGAAAPAPQAPVAPARPAAPVAPAAPAPSVGDEAKTIAALKEYKELLDAGIITQEEFEAKKKTILSR